MRSSSSAKTAGSMYAARCTAPSLTSSISERDREAQMPAVLVGVEEVDALGGDAETLPIRTQPPGRAPGEPALLLAPVFAKEEICARRQLGAILDGDVTQKVVDPRLRRIEGRLLAGEPVDAHPEELHGLVE